MMRLDYAICWTFIITLCFLIAFETNVHEGKMEFQKSTVVKLTKAVMDRIEHHKMTVVNYTSSIDPKPLLTQLGKLKECVREVADGNRHDKRIIDALVDRAVKMFSDAKKNDTKSDVVSEKLNDEGEKASELAKPAEAYVIDTSGGENDTPFFHWNPHIHKNHFPWANWTGVNSGIYEMYPDVNFLTGFNIARVSVGSASSESFAYPMPDPAELATWSVGGSVSSESFAYTMSDQTAWSVGGCASSEFFTNTIPNDVGDASGLKDKHVPVESSYYNQETGDLLAIGRSVFSDPPDGLFELPSRCMVYQIKLSTHSWWAEPLVNGLQIDYIGDIDDFTSGCPVTCTCVDENGSTVTVDIDDLAEHYNVSFVPPRRTRKMV